MNNTTTKKKTAAKKKTAGITKKVPKRKTAPKRLIHFGVSTQIESAKPFEELSTAELIAAMRKYLKRIEQGTAPARSFSLFNELGIYTLRNKKNEEVGRHYYNLGSDIEIKTPKTIKRGKAVMLDCDGSISDYP